VRRLLFAVIVMTLAILAMGGGRSTSRAPRHRAVAYASVHVMHIDRHADSLDDDDDGDDDEEIGLATPPVQLDDDDASPQVASTVDPEISIDEDMTTVPSCAEGLGPAHGHRRAEDRPPRG
jgi:hypothetical protein